MSDKFRMYDHKEKNRLFYNSSTPPEYALGNIIAPVYLYGAAQDQFILPAVSDQSVDFCSAA